MTKRTNRFDDLDRYGPYRSSCDVTSVALDVIESDEGIITVVDHQEEAPVGWRVVRAGITSLSQAERIAAGIERARRREREIACGVEEE